MRRPRLPTMRRTAPLRPLRPLRVAALLLAVLALPGCVALFDRGAPPIDYYVLAPQLPSPAPATLSAAGGSGPVYGVAPVRLPAYLTQQSIATRRNETEINFAADDQWAGPLGDNIRAVLAENLTALLRSNRVIELPVGAAVPVDYQVSVEIIRFERQPDGVVALAARWSTFDDGGRRLLGIYRSDLRAPAAADGFPAITAAMSALLADLARQIAPALPAATPPAAVPLS